MRSRAPCSSAASPWLAQPAPRSFTRGPAGKNGGNGNDGKHGGNGTDAKNGSNGTDGRNGADGTNGVGGAVAGYGAVQSADLDLTNAEAFTEVPGLTKTLPAGSFIAAGSVVIDGSGEKEKETVNADCEMVNTPTSSGAPLVQEGRFLSWTNNTLVVVLVHFTGGEIPFDMAIINNGVSSTLSVRCKEVGRGEKVTVTATRGSVVAVQTSSNS